jgi:hypothetical protein
MLARHALEKVLEPGMTKELLVEDRVNLFHDRHATELIEKCIRHDPTTEIGTSIPPSNEKIVPIAVAQRFEYFVKWTLWGAGVRRILAPLRR